MSDETHVERLLEGIVSIQREAVGDGPEADAIDCGREAIRLLREGTFMSPWWAAERAALLAKCREDGR